MEPDGTVRLTTAEALVRYLVAQRIVQDDLPGAPVGPLFPGVLAIFGHGNATSFGHSLERHRDELPVWRGQNEQGMGLAAAAFAKARRRRQVMVATSSIGPGATNMVTAAGVAMSNRLPVLFVAGDTFTSRLPDPVLQQVEHWGDPSLTVNDTFRPVVRYWDRITHPAQLLNSLPQLVGTLREDFLRSSQGRYLEHPQTLGNNARVLDDNGHAHFDVSSDRKYARVELNVQPVDWFASTSSESGSRCDEDEPPSKRWTHMEFDVPGVPAIPIGSHIPSTFATNSRC